MTDKIEKLANDEIAVIVWPYGAGQKQVGLCFDDEENPSAIFALPAERAFLLREAIFGEALRAEVAALRQQLDAARGRLSSIDDMLRECGIQYPLGAAGVRDLAAMAAGRLEELQEARRELEHWRSGRRRRGMPVVESVPDGLHYAAELVRAQGTEGGEEHDRLLVEAGMRLKGLHDAAGALLADRDRLLDVYRAAEAWRRHRNFEYRPGEINPDLLAARHEDLDLARAVDAYRADAVWTPAKDGDTPGERDIEDDPPQPTVTGVPVDTEGRALTEGQADG